MSRDILINKIEEYNFNNCKNYSDDAMYLASLCLEENKFTNNEIHTMCSALDKGLNSLALLEAGCSLEDILNSSNKHMESIEATKFGFLLGIISLIVIISTIF
ncbi:MAG: hypothetical protein R3Y64_11405 [Peptostreptococcaceae bacterium]